MYLSLNWLKDYVDIPKNVSPEDLGLRLTMHTVEIDGVENQIDKYNHVVIGRILKIRKHPNADRLQVAKVDVKTAELDIVCGAPNIKEGQIVPVALVGAILPNGLEIKAAEVRGELSNGMLCAEDELGLGDDHSGIMILDGGKIGQDFGEYLKMNDVIYEVDNKSITNRPDLWGHFGMAREISTFLKTDKTKKFEEVFNQKINVDINTLNIKVKIDDFELCPRYMAVCMEGIKIEASPKWMQERLIAIGIRPINNIVDITNYVMLDLGQPMHAFDSNLLDEIIVRRAGKEEKIKTLDDNERALNENDLVIANKNKAIAIAGVMGGENTEVNDSTTSIILESANFNPVAIRKTSQRLSLRTEASQRFEKSMDPNLCAIALARAVELIKEICPDAKVASEIIDEKKVNLNQGPIEISCEWIAKRIGFEIDKKEIIKILLNLGFVIEEKEDQLSVTIPTWRATKDISIKEDILEEIARIIGYNNINPQMPKVEMKAPIVNEEKIFERKVKDYLALGTALNEVYNYSFVGDGQLKKLGIDSSEYIRIANPITVTHTMLRQTLAPNLFNNIKTNQARYDEINIFEFGNIYLAMDGELDKDSNDSGKLPYQEKRIGLAFAGKNIEEVLLKAKGVVDNLFASLNLEVEFRITETVPNWAELTHSAQIITNDKVIGYIAGAKKDIMKKNGIKKDVVLIELGFSDLYNEYIKNRDILYHESDKYPPVVRDLAFVVSQKILYNDIRAEILNHHEFIKRVELFDEYHGDKLGKDKKSLAFHVIYQADKTLTSEEVDKIQNSLIKKLEEKFEAKIRDF